MVRTTLSKDTIDEIKKLTRVNSHTQSRILLADCIPGAGTIYSAYVSIESLSVFFGYLTPNLFEIRRSLDLHLWGMMRNQFRNHKEIMKAFY